MEQVQIVGGPRDGELVPYSGPQFREPVPVSVRAVNYSDPSALPPPTSYEFRQRIYDLHYWFDGLEQVPRYVLREQANGLGVPGA